MKAHSPTISPSIPSTPANPTELKRTAPPEESHAKPVKRLFPTPSAAEPSRYQFFKKETAMTDKRKFVCRDPSKIGLVYSYVKNRKPGVRWISVNNPKSKKECRLRHLQMTVAAGEIYRFQVGGPKYRIMETNSRNKALLPISKEVVHYVSFGMQRCVNEKERERRPFSKSDFYEGTGRVLTSRWIWAEEDLNSDNIGLTSDAKGQVWMTGIDPEYSFIPVCARFIERTHKVFYDLRKGDWVDDPSLLASFTEALTPEVYKIFPAGVAFRGSWHFNSWPHYTKALAINTPFLNEKFLQTFKELITRPITLEIAEIHMADETDRTDLCAFINKRLDELLDVAKKSAEFKTYMKANLVPVCGIIFHEIKNFLLENKHYRYQSKDAAMQWGDICNTVIHQLERVIAVIDTAKPTDFFESLRDKALRIYNNDKLVLEEVRDAYANQGMNINANKIIDKLSAMSSQHPSDSEPTSPSKIPAIAPAAPSRKR